MPCLFLTRLGQNYVKSYRPHLGKTYGNQCPIISRTLNNTVNETQPKYEEGSAAKPTPCPFLKGVQNIIKHVSNQDVMEIKSSALAESKATFPYETFVHDQIIKKKKEHSYRIFKKVNRLAQPGQFPKALEYSWGEKSITEWCSNDYLEMSRRPSVEDAVRNALET
ncbi:hypothetical protein WA026_007945 [Henosepilachna vigintioctopunctata]|uniref:Uncharacterized protein n=1 Tax=Henosepilachna vigintioctopunctata TaxID=420089 RepID=A0AAW1TJH5_9CUCU